MKYAKRLIPIGDETELDSQQLIYFHKTAVFELTKAAIINGVVEDICAGQMRGGVVYRLNDLNYILRRSAAYAAGTAPVDGYRELMFSVNKPGSKAAATKDEERDKIGLSYVNDADFPFAFEDDDAMNVSRYTKTVPIAGALARQTFGTKDDLNCRVHADADTAGMDTAAQAGGIEITVWGSMVAVGHSAKAAKR
jgi:hypothetical protein